MISFRYHVVSLVAVLLALAAGIALGSGPLTRSADDAGSGDERALRAAREQAAEAEEELRFADAYAEATADRVVAGRLDDRTVTLLSLPGASDDAVNAVADLVGRAGGAVTARVTLSEQLLDVGNRQLVAELASQMQQEAGAAVEVPADAGDYERMARLLAHAVTSRTAAGEAVDDAGEGILAALSTAELAATQGDIDRRGGLVIAVTGEPYGNADTQEGAGTILATLASALDARSRGTVVAGPYLEVAEDEDEVADAEGTAGGLVAAVRADPAVAQDVSTVDTVERAAGAVGTVLAAAAQDRGRVGHYGSSAAPDGPVPGAEDR